MERPFTDTPSAGNITSVSYLIDFIKDNHASSPLILFRGQREDHPLEPKVARLRLKDGVIAPDMEEQMLSDFKRRSIPYLPGAMETDWDWLALAQHHGMATRLLDWTTNPLIALWFAVEYPPVKPPVGKRHDGVLWLYRPEAKDIVQSKNESEPFDGKRTQVFQPDHIAVRIVAQGGWFTVHKYKLDRVERPPGYIPLDNLVQTQDLLTKLTIPSARFKLLRQELNRCGINSSLVYPGLEGIGRYVEWLYARMEDE